jgi:hypothetical protein
VSNQAGAAANEASVNLTVNETPTITIAPIADGGTLNASEAASDLVIGGATVGVEDGQQVSVVLNGATYTGTVLGNAWTVTIPAADIGDTALPNGAYPVTADVSNQAGAAANEASVNLTVNETPSITIATIPAADVVNASEAATGIAISGATTGVEDGQTVTVAIGGTSDSYTATVTGGVWSVSVPAADAQALSDGSYQVTANVSDQAGNPAVAATQTISVAETLPTATILVANAVLATSQTSTVTIQFSEAVTDFNNADLTVGHATLSPVSSSDGGTTWTATLTPTANINDATNTVTLNNTEVHDTAGNAGSGTTNSNNYAVDTAAPSAPIALALAPASDSGAIGDNITNVALPVITGTGENGDTVNLFDGSTAIGTGTVSGGAWSITSLTPLTQGANTITATQTDTGGNTSVASEPLVVTLDTAAPSAPIALALAPASDSGAAGDNITNVARPVITGAGGNGDTVNLFDGSTAIGTGTVSGGAWSITTLTPLTQGANTITATQTNTAGNTSVASEPLVVTLVPPAPAPSQDGQVTADPTLQGTAAPDTTVTLTENGQAIAPITTGANGQWTFNPSSLPAGVTTIAATETAPDDSTKMENFTLIAPAAPVNSVAATTWTSSDVGALLKSGATLVTPAGTDIVQLVDGQLSVGAATTEAFVARLYEGLLGRTDDVAGLSYWNASMAGESQADIAAGFLRSTEYQAEHPDLSNTDFVSSLYTGLLGRPGDAAGIANWTQDLASGDTRANVLAGFAASSEAQQNWSATTSQGVFAYNADAAPIREMYATVFGREADAGGITGWGNAMQDGMTLTDLGAAIANSAEFTALHSGQSNADFVTSLYQGGLGRQPEAAGATFWTSQLNNGTMTQGGVAIGIATSTEGQHHLSWAL